MKIKYYVPSYGNDIEARNVISETACFITVQYKDWQGRTFSRRVSKDMHFDTFNEARSILIKRAQDKLESLFRQVESQKKVLAQAEAVNESMVKNQSY